MNNPFYFEKLNQAKVNLELSERKKVESDFYLMKRLCSFYVKMLDAQKHVDMVWKPAGEWYNYISEKKFFYDYVTEHNYTKMHEVLINFWRNELGPIVKEYATYDALLSGDSTRTDYFLKSVYRNFLIWQDIYKLPARKLELVAEAGNPWGIEIDGVLIVPKATRYHHNSMQIKNLLKACNGKIIAEVGGGYGGLCHYIHKEINNAVYIDFDLPETLLIAAYYLICNFPDKSIFLFGEGELSENLLNKYDIILLPNFVLKDFKDKSVDVFFNSFSLSEMTKEANAKYISEISRVTRSYFLHNNMDRRGVFNRGFERIPASDYPINEREFLLLSKTYDLFHGHFGDYKEFLYKVV